MTTPLDQYQGERRRNLATWNSKPLLREIYSGFWERIAALVDPSIPGQVVEIGAGIAKLKSRMPQVLATDIFPGEGLDLVCNGYEMPFPAGALSHLVLFDVFHHLSAPAAFFKEARRVLAPAGRVILFEPYLSLCSFPVYGLFHPEPVAWGRPINRDCSAPNAFDYYAAQGNATRLFFLREIHGWPEGWTVFHAEAFCSFAYLLSGGYSKPALYPQCWLGAIQRLDAGLSRWPRLFGARCLVGLRSG